MAQLQAPIDLVSLALDEYVLVKCKSNREISGRLHVTICTVMIGLRPTYESHTCRRHRDAYIFRDQSRDIGGHHQSENTTFNHA